MSLQKFIGAVMITAGLIAIYIAGQSSQGLSGAEAGVMVGGAAAVLIGYCVQGFHKPTE